MKGLQTASKAWADTCNADGEFQLAARYWTGGLRLTDGESVLAIMVRNGLALAGDPGSGAGVLTYCARADLWEKLLAPMPPARCTDIDSLLGRGLELRGDSVLHAQYYPALMRAVELLRPASPVSPAATSDDVHGRFDSPVGRYVHLLLGGHDYRVYFEEAGAGIGLLMQHTAASDGSQWRHLFEVSEITAHFRLIAYDLPFHGKSLPPTTKHWWAERYRLDAPFLRSVPVELAAALDLRSPVFMGCSIGGLLALDLALHHPDVFQAVISLQGALKIEGSELDDLPGYWHPAVSNEYKARAMEGLMSPKSPIALRKETSFGYASGWPPAFLGDLHYYQNQFDLRETASGIDTSKVAVHILSGEYDYSAPPALGRAAHAAIPGSTWSAIPGVGHFPMSENPAELIKHLLPVLERIKVNREPAR